MAKAPVFKAKTRRYEAYQTGKRSQTTTRRVDTRAGGLVLVVEPDNLAGGIALLGTDPSVCDDDVLCFTRLLLACQRGKATLGEGDERIGARLPGLLAASGLRNVDASINDRCVFIHPPYDQAHMQTALAQEAKWADQDISALFGARADARRLFVAGDGEAHMFDQLWERVRAEFTRVRATIATRAYHAGRGFVMYVAGGRRPVVAADA